MWVLNHAKSNYNHPVKYGICTVQRQCSIVHEWCDSCDDCRADQPQGVNVASVSLTAQLWDLEIVPKEHAVGQGTHRIEGRRGRQQSALPKRCCRPAPRCSMLGPYCLELRVPIKALPAVARHLPWQRPAVRLAHGSKPRHIWSTRLHRRGQNPNPVHDMYNGPGLRCWGRQQTEESMQALPRVQRCQGIWLRLASRIGGPRGRLVHLCSSGFAGIIWILLVLLCGAVFG